MILQKLKPEPDLAALAKAIRADNDQPAFALAREVATGTPYALRGETIDRLAPKGSEVTVTLERDYFAKEGEPEQRTLVLQVVQAGRPPPFVWRAAKAVTALLGGIYAAMHGVQALVGGPASFDTVVGGAGAVVAGVFAARYYVAASGLTGEFAIARAALTGALTDESPKRVESVATAAASAPKKTLWSALRWPRRVVSEAASVPEIASAPETAKEDKMVLALPSPGAFDAPFLIAELRREKVTV